MITKLDQDQQNNADALEALGVEYPIEKRYIITEQSTRPLTVHRPGPRPGPAPGRPPAYEPRHTSGGEA